MLSKSSLLSFSIFCLFTVEALAQSVNRPNVVVPNGFEVNSYTGNLYQARTDLTMPAQGMPVDITFSYNISRRNRNWGFGKGWTFTYNMAYTVDAEGVRIERADGKRDLFRKSGAMYVAPVGVYESLVEYQTGKFYLQTKDNRRYYFDNASHKRLTKLQDAKGNFINLTYTDSLLNTLTDGSGHNLGFTWTNGRMTSIADNSCQPTRKVSYEYDNKGNPVKITNNLGDFVRYYYDSTARVVGYTDEGGNNMSIQYNSNSAVIRIASCATTHLFTYVPVQRKTYVTEKVNDQSIVTIYTYDTQGQIAAKKGNCCGYNLDYTYDSQNNVTSKRDGNNKETKYEYDNRGNIIKETDPAGYFNTYAYDPTHNKVTRFQDKNGNVVTYQYDANGNLIQINKPLAVTQKFTYDNKGNKLTETDPNGNVTTYEYNANGYLTKMTNAEGGVTQYSYDCHGNQLSMTDPRNNTTLYEYNAQNQLIKTTDALNRVTSYTYDKTGNLVGMTNALGKLTTYVYDGLKRRISTILPLGNTAQVVYDAQNNVIKKIDANGNGTAYTYNNRQQPLTISDALGNTMVYTYDEAGNKLTETDKRGNTTRFEYDDQYRLIKRTDALSGVIQYSYDPIGNLIVRRDANGISLNYEYDALHRLVKTTDYQGKSILYTYDKNGNLISTKNKNGNITTHTYDRLNRLLTVKDALNGIVSFTYDLNGNALSRKDPLNHSYTTSYDKLNRAISKANPLGETTTYSYDALGNVKTISEPTGNVISINYDDNNRRTSMSDNIGILIQYEFDRNNNVISETDGNNSKRKYKYDALDRVIEQIDGLGKSKFYLYDANGNFTSVIDRNGNKKINAYDQLNRKIGETDALGYTTRFTYDSNGNRISIVDANNNQTFYTYNGLNQLTKEQLANNSAKEYTYDSNGNLKTRKDKSGRITVYNYDAVDRLTKRIYADGLVDSLTYDLAGRRLSANNANATIGFSYDNANRLLSESLNGKVTAYSHNTAAKTKSITYPGGRMITETRNTRQQLISIKDGNSVIASFTYDLGNRLTGKSFANNYKEEYTYDANDWLLTLTCQPNDILNLAYTYDNEGNRLSILKNHRPTHSEKFAYDKTNQLIGAYSGKLVGTLLSDTTAKNRYTYDALQNRITSSEDGVSKVYESNMVNAYSKVTTNGVSAVYTYDANGNRTADDRGVYTYDGENRLKKVNNGTAEHLYDALGRRVKTVTATGSVNYYFDGSHFIEERNTSDIVQKTYVYGIWLDDLISYTDNSNSYYVVNNHEGNVLAVLNSANSVEKYEYNAYGAVKYYSNTFTSLPSSAVNNTHTFSGRPFLSYQNNYDVRARNYDQGNGRFIQQDPLNYVEGYNLYAYVNNNPTNSIDPFGLWSSSPTTIHIPIPMPYAILSYFFDYHIDVDLSDPVHQMAIEKALKDINEFDRESLKRQQEAADAKENQSAECSYKHGMTDGSGNSSYRQTREEARQKANDFVRDEIEQARKAEQMGNHEEAMKHLGNAMHTLQDATSPSHEGEQVWKGDEWYRLPQTLMHVFPERNYPEDDTRLLQATRDAYEYYKGKPMPDDFFAPPIPPSYPHSIPKTGFTPGGFENLRR